MRILRPGRQRKIALALLVLVVMLVGLRLWPKADLRERLVAMIALQDIGK
jgi:hypothetical protein